MNNKLKALVKISICSLPMFVKYRMASLVSLLNKDKMKAIKSIDKYSDNNFPNLNIRQYKNNVQKYLKLSDLTTERTNQFIQYLYKDKLINVHNGIINENYPYIICVVKNEEDKLIHFFDHYNSIGNFNYIFIDNGSTDKSMDLMIQNNATVYLVKEKFITQRKLCWINKVYSSIPTGSWVLQLDADELLVYDGYEKQSLNNVINTLEKYSIFTCGAVMIDMFSIEKVPKNKYFDSYIYFENSFHEEKSFYFNSVYGGIREREFNPNKSRTFLLKKHPLTKKEKDSLLVSCHYVFPFGRNVSSKLFFGLLHYKLFDSELEQYKIIAQNGSYGKGGGSSEYKAYVDGISNRSYEEIFRIDENTVLYDGTNSLMKIKCLKDVRTIK